eukprot:7766994-Alexandrium_andersonii.AAC.1
MKHRRRAERLPRRGARRWRSAGRSPGGRGARVHCPARRGTGLRRSAARGSSNSRPTRWT